METCVRGFSFMSESKAELVDLQYIEGGELERAWRSSRRERMKKREQKIWDEFVKEKDIVKGVCTDDPYQFLDQLPESCLKEIMESELEKMAMENSEEEARAKELMQQGNSDSSGGEDGQHTCVVTFADDIDKDDCDMFHIFDDEQSGAEDEVQNESRSPSTVRERPAETTAETTSDHSQERPISLEKTSSKSSENVTNVIESSIYCAKVKDLRMKINEELMALMTTLDRRDILSAEPDDIGRMIKRSAEFCARFNRIYMYQLQRQIHDIKRNNSMSLPFAKHTQFQSQMVRIVSLHQNLLQSFQVFHKSFSSTCCVRESAGALGAMLAAVRDASHMCLNVPPPKDFSAATDLYKDELLATCDKVDDFISEYAIRCEEFLNSFENANIAYLKKNSSNSSKNNKSKKRSFGQWSRQTVKNDTEARLSMYSLDTLRLNLHAKSSSSRDNQISSGKRGGTNGAAASAKRGAVDKNADVSKSQRRSRRPLMRDPHAGRPRAPRPTRDTDIRTMVEAVGTCASSHISREASPHGGGAGAARRSKASTPRRAAHAHHAPRTPHYNTDRRHQPPSPIKIADSPKNQKLLPDSPKPNNMKVSMSSVRTEQMDMLTPVCRIQCAMKKDLECSDSGRRVDSSRSDGSSKKPAVQTGHREDDRNNGIPDSGEVKAVSKIQCAKKRDMEVEDSGRHGECSRTDSSPKNSAAHTVNRDEVNDRKERERAKIPSMAPDRCEVTRLLKQLCSGDASGTERVTGAKNAQLLYVSGSSPRQPSTPQLLRILEETIQKKVPKPLFQKPLTSRPDRYRLVFNIADKTADALFQYRTKFVQHMLTSAMYANSAVGKPWEMIGSVSEQIIDELLLSCTKEMEVRDLIQELYKRETS